MRRIDLTAFSKEPIQGHTSKGDQPKWKVGDFWYKGDHMGHEGLAETVVSQLLEHSNVTDLVRYEPILICDREKEYVGCVSPSFRGEQDMLIPFEHLHRAYRGQGLARALGAISGVKERIRYTVEFVEGVTGLTGVGPYLTLLLEMDAFFLNEDRHTNNLAVIRDEKTKQFRLCPIFDNGLALLSDHNDYPLERDLYTCIQYVQAKPFDLDFDTQVDAAEELYGMQLRLNFSRETVHTLLSQLEEFYPVNIIQRTERVLLEQMRKYQIYF